MTAHADIPKDGRPCRLTNVTVPACLVDGAPAAAAVDADGLLRLDLTVADGRIAAIDPAIDPAGASAGGPAAPHPAIDMDAGMAWPCFADVHTHLDKGHIWPRRRNPDGSRPGALSATAEDRAARWTADDVRTRMDFSLRCAWAHGTAAIRTHIDSTPPQHAVSWPVVRELREEWRGRIALQPVSLEPLPGFADAAYGDEIADLVKESGGVLGAVMNIQDDTDALLDRVIGLALDRDLEIDFHIDEMSDPEARSFDRVAEALIRNRYGRPVNVGHCCSLAVRPADEVDRALDRAAEADMRVVSLPMCNMFLQDRMPGRTPRWRGVTVLHEMKARGIPVQVASDNTRDPFYAYGDLDAVEVFTQAVRIAHLDYPVGDWPAAIARTPADTMGEAEVGRIAVGGPADLVLFRARSWSEFLPRPQHDRTVLRAGAPIDTTPPDYRELDPLLV